MRPLFCFLCDVLSSHPVHRNEAHLPLCILTREKEEGKQEVVEFEQRRLSKDKVEGKLYANSSNVQINLVKG